MSQSSKETPLMKQYNAIKAKYPDAILLFRVGDFYETFGSDAIYAAKVLEITLTKRANGAAAYIELAGFPHHALDTYLHKLVKSGKRVAICDQLEDPKTVKGIVKRGVTEIVTPAVTFNDNILNQKSNSFLLSFHEEKGRFGVALLDVSTGELLVSEGNESHLQQLISSFHPNEIIYQRNKNTNFSLATYHTFKLEDWAFQYDFAYEKLINHFKTNSLKGFGVEELKLAITACGAIFSYLIDDTHHTLLEHISQIQKIPNDEFVWLDSFTIRNLELIESPHLNGKTLLQVIDQTQTAMGGRMLKRWILLPLQNVEKIAKRNETVQFFLNHTEISRKVEESLQRISDVERLVGKMSSIKITPRELGNLRTSLQEIGKIEQLFQAENTHHFIGKFKDLMEAISLLENELEDELPVALNKGFVIKKGRNETLDTLRNLKTNGQDYLASLCEREQQHTGISSLKIDFNNVFGYYIEVRNTHKDKVPPDWIRKQTLVNAERYITEELKEYETQILGAEEKIMQLENAIFQQLIQKLSKYIIDIQYNAKLIAQIDCLLSFAKTASENHYTKPQVTPSKDIDIQEGRHPVIEKQLANNEPYVPNDVFISPENQQILMITGPNMSGKSALLRQTALITLLAQIGSYVPAKHAKIGVVDKIFTRVGASDNLSQGESTFMVEMNETASILNAISERSLILLDEIGRGTSTYDGVSIAWAIAAYLHQHPTQPKTLFATHYHELNEMTHNYQRIKNYNVSIKENNGNILFVRKLKPGGSEHSFGIHVAKLAGMPKTLIQNAEEILLILEENHTRQHAKKQIKKVTEENLQLSFFQLDDPVLENIREQLLHLDINTLTPIEALMKLNQIKNLLGK